jgi:hypothetical protein
LHHLLLFLVVEMALPGVVVEGLQLSLMLFLLICLLLMLLAFLLFQGRIPRYLLYGVRVF